MSATLTAPARMKLVTADDLLHLWEQGKAFEVIDDTQGREFEVSKESSRVAGEVYYRLRAHADRRPAWVFPEGTSYRCFTDDEERTRRPDASVIALDRMPPATYEDEGHCTTVPDLVAEVISPKDTAYAVEKKRGEWVDAGVRLVWLVYPETRTVYAYGPDGTITLFRRTDTLTAPDVLPGFAVPVADLFRLPGQPAAPPPAPAGDSPTGNGPAS